MPKTRFGSRRDQARRSLKARLLVSCSIPEPTFWLLLEQLHAGREQRVSGGKKTLRRGPCARPLVHVARFISAQLFSNRSCNQRPPALWPSLVSSLRRRRKVSTQCRECLMAVQGRLPSTRRHGSAPVRRSSSQ